MKKQEVIKADYLGYCMGVTRVVKLAEDALVKYKGKKIYSLGPLIHNRQALETLYQKGLIELSVDDIEKTDLSNSVVIIRAHGVAQEIEQKLKSYDCIILNGTCPRVVSSQKRVCEYAKKGYSIILAGDKKHGEIISLEGFAKNNFISYISNLDSDEQECIIVENVSDAQNIQLKNNQYVLIAQTTISENEFDSISKILKERFPDLQIINTVCSVTTERQGAIEKLCHQVDGIIVVGGKNSANTQRLFMTAKNNSLNPLYRCNKVIHIETPLEIPQDFFSLEKVGIAAGASTSNEIIDSVVKFLSK